MRIPIIVTAAAATAALTAGFAAIAQTNYEPARTAVVPIEQIRVQPANQPFGPYHGGYVTYRDEQLLSDAIGALKSERDMNGVIVTIVANNGELVVNGTATVSQGARIESRFKRLAGVSRVTTWFDWSGA